MAIPAQKLAPIGDLTIDGDGDVHLPDEVLRAARLNVGDRVWVTMLDGERIMLSKRPDDVVAYFAGALTDLYPDPDETRRFLDEGRGYGDESDPLTEA